MSHESLPPTSKPNNRDDADRHRALHFTLLACLLVVQTLLLAWSGYRHGPGYDEPAHLASGVIHWRLGRFEPYRVNPPLVRMVAAIPLVASGADAVQTCFDVRPGSRSEFRLGSQMMEAEKRRFLWMLSLGRWACLPFAWVGLVVCYLWASQLFGPKAGLAAAALWTFSPNILAHAQLVTPDAGAAAVGLAVSFRQACGLGENRDRRSEPEREPTVGQRHIVTSRSEYGNTHQSRGGTPCPGLIGPAVYRRRNRHRPRRIATVLSPQLTSASPRRRGRTSSPPAGSRFTRRSADRLAEGRQTLALADPNQKPRSNSHGRPGDQVSIRKRAPHPGRRGGAFRKQATFSPPRQPRPLPLPRPIPPSPAARHSSTAATIPDETRHPRRDASTRRDTCTG